MAELASPLELLPVVGIDVARTAALINAAFGTYAHLFKGPRTSAEFLPLEAGPEASFLQLGESGTLLASAMVKPARALSHEEQASFLDAPLESTLYFGLAAVDPARMNGGFGRALVSAAEDEARRLGLDRVILGTVREFGLVPYYEKAGYRVCNSEQYPAGYWTFFEPFTYCSFVKTL